MSLNELKIVKRGGGMVMIHIPKGTPVDLPVMEKLDGWGGFFEEIGSISYYGRTTKLEPWFRYYTLDGLITRELYVILPEKEYHPEPEMNEYGEVTP